MATKIVYKITYPNGKIYVGMDVTNSINYFGSASDALIARDFTPEQRLHFTITRDVLWSSETAADREVAQVEREFIRQLRSDAPQIGYNQRRGRRTLGAVSTDQRSQTPNSPRKSLA